MDRIINNDGRFVPRKVDAKLRIPAGYIIIRGWGMYDKVSDGFLAGEDDAPWCVRSAKVVNAACSQGLILPFKIARLDERGFVKETLTVDSP